MEFNFEFIKGWCVGAVFVVLLVLWKIRKDFDNPKLFQNKKLYDDKDLE